MNRNICTLSDYNYSDKGLALYDSLVLCSSDFTLYYLCIDDRLYDKLLKLNLPKLVPLRIGCYRELDNKSSSYMEYCWSLGSRLCSFLMKRHVLPEILYVDSDIVFYADVEHIFEAVKGKSVGVIPHLHVPVGHYVGGYNVGIIYFRGDDVGKECLDFWVNCVITPDGPYHKSHGTCGDQKYLELFEVKYPEAVTVIFDKASHVAPWNAQLYNYGQFDMARKNIIYLGKTLPLVFAHFSHFAPFYETDTYKLITHGYDLGILGIPAVVSLYADYYQRCKRAHMNYGI